jgi:Flp pilus assembly pilin Flp
VRRYSGLLSDARLFGGSHCASSSSPGSVSRDCHCAVYLEESAMKHLTRFVREDEGQDLVEYALLITFIALACIVGMQQLGTAINNRYNSISSSLAS